MRLKKLAISLIKDMASAFLPFECHLCKTDTDFGEVLCPDCYRQMLQNLHLPRLIEDTHCNFPVYTLSDYNSIMADIVRVVKYRPSAKLLRILAASCQKAGQLTTLLSKNDVLVAVPMHQTRLNQRGFNQASELAAAFAEAAGCRAVPLLQRIRATRPQADCNEEERAHNLARAFALNQTLVADNWRRQRLVLIDDVATTGGTLQACADTLLGLKPREICAVVASHSYRQSNSQAKIHQ